MVEFCVNSLYKKEIFTVQCNQILFFPILIHFIPINQSSVSFNHKTINSSIDSKFESWTCRKKFELHEFWWSLWAGAKLSFQAPNFSILIFSLLLTHRLIWFKRFEKLNRVKNGYWLKAYDTELKYGWLW